MIDLKNLAMITDFYVECRTVAVNIPFVKGIGSGKLPCSCRIDALQHSIKRMMPFWQGLFVVPQPSR